MKKKFACVGVLTSSGLQRSVHVQPLTPVHRDIQQNLNKKNKKKKNKKMFALPPKPIADAKSITISSVIISGGGASQELQGTSQSTGVQVPSKNRR